MGLLKKFFSNPYLSNILVLFIQVIDIMLHKKTITDELIH